MKYIYISIILSFLSILSYGQVRFHGLTSNAFLNTKSSNRTVNITDTLNLPFVEDFAYHSSSPNSSLWLDQYVYINNNFAQNPPSVGVATFDILDENGLIYDTADVSVFIADYLTSKPIDLSTYSPNDSIYFSFYYQPQGYGWDSPDENDSLVLQFRTSQNDWSSIYAIPGTPLKDFEQVMLPIVDTLYLKQDFQFRFYNYATIGGSQNQEDAIANDFWNLDYIVIDTARTTSNPYHNDLTFYDRNASLFYDYYSVPWKHYQLTAMTLDSVDYKLKNLDNQTHPFNDLIYLLKQNNTLVLDSFENGSGNVTALSTVDKLYSQNNMGGDDHNSLPSTLTDSTILSVTRYFSILDTLQRNRTYAINDTVKYSQYFYNYYAYDDGTAEAGISIIGYEAQFAFKINALKADTLRGLSMFFNRYKDYGTADESVFSICVWSNDNGKPGNLLYKEDNIKPKYTNAKNAFSTYKFENPVFIDSTTFFVGWKNDTRKVYSLGYDFNNNNKEQVYYNISGYWEPLAKGTPMIRAIMGDDFVDVSIKAIDPENNIKIYPNPTTDKIQIELDHIPTAVIHVYNSTGALLFKQNISNHQIINLKKFGSGLFIIKINNKKQSIVKKIIVL